MADEKKLNLTAKLLAIQNELKAPKGQYNSFGKYKYRSAEDILEAVKPLCAKYKMLVFLKDEIQVVGTEKVTTRTLKDGVETETCVESLRTYIVATATIIDTEGAESLSVMAQAREPQTKTGMDAPQITGTASSYARKYALNGLFCIDDTKDADTDEYHNETVVRTKTKKTVDEYNKLIDGCETENEINTLYYEWSKVYVKGTAEYTSLSKKSFDRKKQIVGA